VRPGQRDAHDGRSRLGALAGGLAAVERGRKLGCRDALGS